MSEEKDEKKSGHCHWCDTLTNNIIKEYKEGRLVWVGCADCFVKKKELEKDGDSKQI